MDQNRGLWDQLQIRRGMLALARARQLGGAGGFYALQAAIIACHAQASAPDETPWPRIAELYAELAALVRSPVIELNRAVAVGMAQGPAAALAIVDRLAHEPMLKAYHLLPSVRGDLLQKLGRSAEVLHASAELLASPSGSERAPEIHFVRGNVYSQSDPAAAAREYALAGAAPGRIGDDAAFLEALNLEKSNKLQPARAAFERYLARAGGRHATEAKAHLTALSASQATEPH